MNPSQCTRSRQQARLSHHASNADSLAFLDLLTGPQLLDRLEAQLPEHRERKFSCLNGGKGIEGNVTRTAAALCKRVSAPLFCGS